MNQHAVHTRYKRTSIFTFTHSHSTKKHDLHQVSILLFKIKPSSSSPSTHYPDYLFLMTILILDTRKKWNKTKLEKGRISPPSDTTMLKKNCCKVIRNVALLSGTSFGTKNYCHFFRPLRVHSPMIIPLLGDTRIL